MMWRTGGATPAEGCRRAGGLPPCKDEVNVLYCTYVALNPLATTAGRQRSS